MTKSFDMPAGTAQRILDNSETVKQLKLHYTSFSNTSSFFESDDGIEEYDEVSAAQLWSPHSWVR